MEAACSHESIPAYHRRYPSEGQPVEGSPRALREAVACGLPVIASDIPGHRGIDPQGHFIRFVTTGDREAWVSITREALYDSVQDRQQRSERGVRWLRDHHQPNIIAQRWLELYLKIAQQRGLT